MNQFGRVGSIIVGSPGTIGHEYTGLNFSFSIKKTITPEMNPATVIVTNLSKDTIAGIHERETVCIIKAGYIEAEGAIEIFRGYVSNVSSVKNKTAWETTIELRDGYEELRASTFAKSYAGGASIKNILADIVKSFNLPNNIKQRLLSIADKKLPRGISFNGLSKDALQDIAELAGIEWSIQSGKLKFLEKNKADEQTAFLLSKESGLLGSPTRLSGITISKSKQPGRAEMKQTGWSLTSFLLPTIEPGNKVSVTSAIVSGVFKVINVLHTGELFGQTWATTLEVIDI
jgi:hypothetical protein